MAKALDLIARIEIVLDQLASEHQCEFLLELCQMSFAATGSLSGAELVLIDWETSLALQADPGWWRQMAESQP